MDILENISKDLKIASCAMTAMRWLDTAKRLTACVLVAVSACMAYSLTSACMKKKLGE